MHKLVFCYVVHHSVIILRDGFSLLSQVERLVKQPIKLIRIESTSLLDFCWVLIYTLLYIFILMYMTGCMFCKWVLSNCTVKIIIVLFLDFMILNEPCVCKLNTLNAMWMSLINCFEILWIVKVLVELY